MNMDDAAAHATQYLAVTDAMGYQAGPGLLSPEEYAAELRKDAERYRFLRAVDCIPISTKAARDPVAYDAAIDAAMQRARAAGAV
jgi:hypothetical protein